MQHVLQKHARGCGIAVLSMLTGHSYEGIASYFDNPDLEKKGIYLRGLDDFLADHGYAIARKSRYFGFFHQEGGAPLREPWPPEPFADAHVCEVEVCEGAPCYHFVVMLRDGSVLDPLAEGNKRLSDYHRVLNVAGVFRCQ